MSSFYILATLVGVANPPLIVEAFPTYRECTARLSSIVELVPEYGRDTLCIPVNMEGK